MFVSIIGMSSCSFSASEKSIEEGIDPKAEKEKKEIAVKSRDELQKQRMEDAGIPVPELSAVGRRRGCLEERFRHF